MSVAVWLRLRFCAHVSIVCACACSPAHKESAPQRAPLASTTASIAGANGHDLAAAPAQTDASPGLDAHDVRGPVDTASTDAGNFGKDRRLVLDFLDYISSVTEAADSAAPDRYGPGFDPRRFAKVDAQRLLKYVSDRGVTFENVNSSTFHVTKKQLRQNIVAKQGRAFRSLAHLAYIYWQSSRSRSIDFHESPEEVKVWLGEKYEMVFHTTTDKAGLVRVRYLFEETE